MKCCSECGSAQRTKMNSMWASLKNSIDCKKHLSDVIQKRKGFCKVGIEKNAKNKKRVFQDANLRKPSRSPSENCLCELSPGDPSRSIIEKIFYAASMNPLKHQWKIKRVFKVKNTPQTLKQFEQYREIVKQKSQEQHKWHLRSTVDGNELLCFYATTMACSSSRRKQPKQVTEPCRGRDCRLCRIVASNFDTENKKDNGIQLCVGSDTLSANLMAIAKGNMEKRVVIICRLIAGRIMASNEETGGCGSQRGGDFLNSEYLIVKNPNAVLPCFVMVL